jgi:hypothetical protein
MHTGRSVANVKEYITWRSGYVRAGDIRQETYVLRNINWLVFMPEIKNVYCAVQPGFLNAAFHVLSLKG